MKITQLNIIQGKCRSISTKSRVPHPVWEQLWEEEKGSAAHPPWTKTWNYLLPNPTLGERFGRIRFIICIYIFFSAEVEK